MTTRLLTTILAPFALTVVFAAPAAADQQVLPLHIPQVRVTPVRVAAVRAQPLRPTVIYPTRVVVPHFRPQIVRAYVPPVKVASTSRVRVSPVRVQAVRVR